MISSSKVSKVFFWAAGVLAALVFSFMAMHVYLGERYFDTGRNFFPPASRFMHTERHEFSFAVMGDTGDNIWFWKRLSAGRVARPTIMCLFCIWVTW